MTNGKKAWMSGIVTMGLVFSLMLGGCGSGEDVSESTSASTSKNTTTEVDTEAKVDSSVNAPDTDKSAPAEWEEFLDEYEGWVDAYVVFVDKYLENPTDMSLISDYATMTSDMTEWASKADDMQKSLSPEEVTQYLERVGSISEKLNTATKKITTELLGAL